MYWFYLGFEVVAAYLIGSVSSAVWVGNTFYGVDVRKHGSGNAGATNVIRVLGYKAGIPVLLFDVFKGWIAVMLGVWIHPGLNSADAIVYLKIVLAFAAVLGHVFPVFAGFKGGKGVGTLAGAGIGLFPLAFAGILAVFIVTLVISHYVSLSSILASLSLPMLLLVIDGFTGVHTGLFLLSLLIAIFIPITHRKNIRRLLRGEENRFEFRRSDKNRPG